MFSWWQVANSLHVAGEIYCRVSIVKTKGSTPRDVGATMLVTGAGIYGSIGGGNLEQEAIEKSRALLQSTDTSPQILTYILGPDMEQCCGGQVVMELKHCTDVAFLSSRRIRRKQVMLFGAGHVGKALFNALIPLPFYVRWFDGRRDIIKQIEDAGTHDVDGYPNLRVQHIKHMIGVEIEKNALCLVMTHDHELDYKLVRLILQEKDAAFCGLIGSKTKRARFLSRLKKDGLKDKQIARLTCPIGLDGIQGKEPEIIAASVAAQLLQMRTNNGD